MVEMLTSKIKLELVVSPLSANPAKWSNSLKQFVGKLPTNCLSVFDPFVDLLLKVLICFRILSRGVFRTQSNI